MSDNLRFKCQLGQVVCHNLRLAPWQPPECPDQKMSYDPGRCHCVLPTDLIIYVNEKRLAIFPIKGGDTKYKYKFMKVVLMLKKTKYYINPIFAQPLKSFGHYNTCQY